MIRDVVLDSPRLMAKTRLQLFDLITHNCCVHIPPGKQFASFFLPFSEAGLEQWLLLSSSSSRQFVCSCDPLLHRQPLRNSLCRETFYLEETVSNSSFFGCPHNRQGYPFEYALCSMALLCFWSFPLPPLTALVNVKMIASGPYCSQDLCLYFLRLESNRLQLLH